jgi:hypothetical protein
MDNRLVQSTEAKVRAVEERIQRVAISEETKFQTLTDQLLKLEEVLNSERLQSELLLERSQKDVSLMENTVRSELENIMQTREDSLSRLDKTVISKSAQFIDEITNKKKKEHNFIGVMDNFNKFGIDLAHTRQEVDKLRKQRIENKEKIESAISAEIERLTEQVDQERHKRSEKFSRLYVMLENVFNRCDMELDHLKLDTSDGQERLINRLEESCNIIESSIHMRSNSINIRN